MRKRQTAVIISIIAIELVVIIFNRASLIDALTQKNSKYSISSLYKPSSRGHAKVAAKTTPPPNDSTKKTSSTTTTPPANSGSWSVDFTKLANGALNSSQWAFDIGNGGPDNPGWGNNEVEYYTNSTTNASISNGNLVIKAQKQSLDGFNYTSAKVTTLNKESFLYGKVDVVAKLPAGDGTWPAIWMMPVKDNYAINTAAGWSDPNNWLRDGELDVMEEVGAYPGIVSSSAQSYTYNPSNNNERVGTTDVADYSTNFHDYSINWTPTTLTFAIDGNAYHTVTKQPTDSTLIWPYNEPYYLIMNIAMGGDAGGVDKTKYPPYGINDASGPWQMDVKSVSYTPYN